MRWKRASGYKPYIECKEGSERDAVEKRDVYAHGRSRVSVKRRGAAFQEAASMQNVYDSGLRAAREGIT